MLTLYRFAPEFIKKKYAFLWLTKLTKLLKENYRLSDAINLLALDRDLVIFTALRINQRIADDISQGVRLSDSMKHRNEHKYFPSSFWQIIQEAEGNDDFIGTIEKTIEKYDRNLLGGPKGMESIKDVIRDFPPGTPMDCNLLVGDLPNAPVLKWIKLPINLTPVPLGTDCSTPSVAGVKVISTLINMVLAQALKENASKILFTPEPKIFRLEFVINGRNEKKPTIPLKFAPEVIARIEIMAGLDYWKQHKQAGKFNFCAGGIHSDIEVTTEKSTGNKKAELNIWIKK